MTYRMIYSSRANWVMSVSDLEAILLDARTGNEARNVTGAGRTSRGATSYRTA